jgi:hypothetical protein
MSFIGVHRFLKMRGVLLGCLEPQYCIKNQIYAKKAITNPFDFEVVGTFFGYLKLTKLFLGVMMVLVRYLGIKIY